MIRLLEFMALTFYIIMGVILLKFLSLLLPGYGSNSVYHIQQTLDLPRTNYTKGIDENLYILREFNFHLWSIIAKG